MCSLLLLLISLQLCLEGQKVASKSPTLLPKKPVKGEQKNQLISGIYEGSPVYKNSTELVSEKLQFEIPQTVL